MSSDLLKKLEGYIVEILCLDSGQRDSLDEVFLGKEEDDEDGEDHHG